MSSRTHIDAPLPTPYPLLGYGILFDAHTLTCDFLELNVRFLPVRPQEIIIGNYRYTHHKQVTHMTLASDKLVTS